MFNNHLKNTGGIVMWYMLEDHGNNNLIGRKPDPAIKKLLNFSTHVIRAAVQTMAKDVKTPVAKQALETLVKTYATKGKKDPSQLLYHMLEAFKVKTNIENDEDRKVLDQLYSAYEKAIETISKSKDLKDLVTNKFDELAKIAEENGEVGQFIYSALKDYVAVKQFDKKAFYTNLAFAIAVIIVSYYILMKLTHEKNPIKIFKKTKVLLKSGELSTTKKIVLLFVNSALLLGTFLFLLLIYRYIKYRKARSKVYSIMQNKNNK